MRILGLGRSRFTLGLVVLTAGWLATSALGARTLIEAGPATAWKFLDTGTEPPAGWRRPGFDDSQWKSGPAPLGYGEERLSSKLSWGTNLADRHVTTWFRREFVAPEFRAGDRLVILLCVDDGAVLHVNGRELARLNMPKGPLGPRAMAARPMTSRDEGFYFRLPLPAAVFRSGRTNVIAVEVHQAATNSSDLFFDLALKTLPPDAPVPKVTAEARPALEAYFRQHYVGFDTRIPDGYVDGGRYMRMDNQGRTTSGREILLVDRAHDGELQKQLGFASSAEVRRLPELERVQRLAGYVDERTTPPGGLRWVGETVEQLTREFANKPLRIGDVIEQSQAGVCRHRALLFKLLADEAGLKAALVRGNYAAPGQARQASTPRGFAHAWNEVQLNDGRRVLVDVMHHGGKAFFPEVTSSNVVARYLKENDSPWYAVAGADTKKRAPRATTPAATPSR